MNALNSSEDASSMALLYSQICLLFLTANMFAFNYSLACARQRKHYTKVLNIPGSSKSMTVPYWAYCMWFCYGSILHQECSSSLAFGSAWGFLFCFSFLHCLFTLFFFCFPCSFVFWKEWLCALICERISSSGVISSMQIQSSDDEFPEFVFIWGIVIRTHYAFTEIQALAVNGTWRL